MLKMLNGKNKKNKKMISTSNTGPQCGSITLGQNPHRGNLHNIRLDLDLTLSLYRANEMQLASKTEVQIVIHITY